MNLREFPSDPRLQELLAGHVLGDLDPSEQKELQDLAKAQGMDLESLDFSSLDLAAASVAMAQAARESQPLPAHLRDQLLRAADQFIAGPQFAERASGSKASKDAGLRIASASGVAVPSRTLKFLALTGWLAAAAAITLAVIFGRSTPRASSLDQFLSTTPDVVRAPWGDWDGPELAGVTGEVVWSNSRQAGFMRFKGLPPNDPTREQYQLWIVDERGLADATGQSARISGGVFSVGASGEVVVPIDPALKVGKAQLFALTIEKPGGTWVSDMKRRVVIAAVK